MLQLMTDGVPNRKLTKTSKASQSQARRWQREKKLERVLPTHVWRWIRMGVVAPELRQYVLARSEHAAAMIEDLGGEDSLTAMERATLDGWLQSQVVADVLFARFLQTADVNVAQEITRYTNTARSQLSLLGLERRHKKTLELSEYTAAFDAEKVAQSATQDVEATPA